MQRQHQPPPNHGLSIADVLISPTFKALQQTNLLEIRPMGKSVIFRLPDIDDDYRSPPTTRDERQVQRQTMFRHLYSTRVVSNDDNDGNDEFDGHYARSQQVNHGSYDGLRPMEGHVAGRSAGIPAFAETQKSSSPAPAPTVVKEDTFFSPIAPALTPSSARTDTFFTPELASPTLLTDIQSSESISELQNLRLAFGTDYPSLSRRAEARINDLLLSPHSVLAGERLVASPPVTSSSLSTSAVSLEMSLSLEDEEELTLHLQRQQQARQTYIRPDTSKMFERGSRSTLDDQPATFRSISDHDDLLDNDRLGISELASPISSDNEYEELLASVQELRNQNQALQTDIRNKVLELQQVMQDTKDTEQKLLSQIQIMQQSLATASEQTEHERKFFMQVQLNLNRRLKEAKHRLERVSRDRETMISGLKQLFTTADSTAVSTMEVDELIQKAAQSIRDHQDANRALTTCLETAQKEIRSAKEAKHKSEKLLAVATNRSRKLELENKQLLAQVKALSQELGESRTQVHEAIEAQKHQQLLQWQEVEKKYLAIIQDLRGNLAKRENTVSMDIYRHAVAEAKRHAEQSQYYQQCAKNSSERLRSLERVVLARRNSQQNRNDAALKSDETVAPKDEKEQKEKLHQLYTDDLWRPSTTTTRPDDIVNGMSAASSERPLHHPTSVPPRLSSLNNATTEHQPTKPEALRLLQLRETQPVGPPPTTAMKNVSKPDPTTQICEQRPRQSNVALMRNKSKPALMKPPPPKPSAIRFMPPESRHMALPPPQTAKKLVAKPEPRRAKAAQVEPSKTDNRLESENSETVQLNQGDVLGTQTNASIATGNKQASHVPNNPSQQALAPTLRSRPPLINTTSSNKNIPKQVRFKVSTSPRSRLVKVTPPHTGAPAPQKAPPEPFIRVQPSKENSWMTPSRSSASSLRVSLVRAAGGRLKLQSILREKRQSVREATSVTN